ncbi:MAG: hypothetical protein JSW58_13175 [Candidatus Latescibacterota bacterium]|nr:MAG: hypothetical protein JSW58_13175 [Candidatus Latescibacterota bacterium]
MKKVLYLSISIMCLSVSALIGFHIGSTSVRAKTPGSRVVGFAFWSDQAYVILENGDVYRNSAVPRTPAVYIGNYWGTDRSAPDGSSGGDDEKVGNGSE